MSQNPFPFYHFIKRWTLIFHWCHWQLYLRKLNRQCNITVDGFRYPTFRQPTFYDLNWRNGHGGHLNSTMQLLQPKPPRRLISRRGELNWPPRSTDLTPLFFGIFWKERCMQIIHRPFRTSRWKFDELLTKFSHNYWILHF